MKHTNKIIGCIIITIIILIVWSLYKQKDKINLPKLDTDVVTDQTDEIIEAQNYEYTDPQDWKFYDNALKDIQSLQNGQKIEYGIVRDPINNNIVYFTSSTQPNNDGNVLLSIYKYNENDYSFERIWRESFNDASYFKMNAIEMLTPVIHLAGYENNNLILLAQYIDDSPGPCSSLYLMGTGNQRGTRNLITLDLSNPYGGFKNYEPTKEALEAADSWTTACDRYQGISSEEQDEIRNKILDYEATLK